MSQSPRACPNCGTPAPAGQRFCSNCGTDMSLSGPASQYGGQQPQSQPPSHPYDQSPYAPPSSPQQPVQPMQPMQPGQQYNQASMPNQQYQQYQQPPQKSNGFAELLSALGLVFFMRRYRPGYRARRQSSGCCGCLFLLVLMGIIFGIPGYLYYRQNPHFIQNLQNQIQHSVNTNSSNNGNPPTKQPPITTANINQSVIYAGVNFTIESAQQSTTFLDDPSTSDNNGVVRVKYKETNHSGQDVVYFAGQIDHLILPDKSSVDPVNSLQGGGIQNATTRENWADFAVPTSDKISQLTLVIGGSQEAQIFIPLTGNANLSAYQNKTANLNKLISYQGLNYTLQSATESLSIPTKQATPGMRYVVLAFKVDNPTANDKGVGGTSDYMRLQAGGVTSSPVNSTLPGVVNANTSGATGTVTFLMPQNNNSFTLIFLAAQGYSTVQVNTDFNI
jgi:hypothetical protein